ncbi:Glu/Leu/Phe/Val dehydrogenase dimerization domain-containing protein [Jiangella endophytica]|uniref:Glu/Leu/Phe/Val dehydrogenase dimerization domain-containing protein n=1 Tax=Jiangella endophytica TaxID=1623398 RepID=UPI000E3567AD|nr:Glu/Leu/Phe/Val dehydrogenase dimerization domain-containing protein [Jiangella endophytica]
MRLLDVPEELTAQRLVICSDPDTGLRAVIAIDDTTLGPGFGGVRMRHYPTVGRAIDEAQRLAAAMTVKNALAAIPYGGAKSVVLTGEGRPDRVRLMRRFGQFVAELSGAYLPGVDMGTTPADMRLMAEVGADTTCADEDPAPWTAAGVFHAISSAVRFELGADSLAGVRVLVQGVGQVGEALAHQLVAAGALVDVSDVDAARATRVAAAVGGAVVDVDRALTHRCDVLVPCAVARVLTRDTIPGLRCSIVAGAANDTLDDPGCADLLAAARVLFVPDFVANAGGVRFVHVRRGGGGEQEVEAAVAEIGGLVTDLLETASSTGLTPYAAAHARAVEVLTERRAATPPPGVAVVATAVSSS